MALPKDRKEMSPSVELQMARPLSPAYSVEHDEQRQEVHHAGAKAEWRVAAAGADA